MNHLSALVTRAVEPLPHRIQVCCFLKLHLHQSATGKIQSQFQLLNKQRQRRYHE